MLMANHSLDDYLRCFGALIDKIDGEHVAALSADLFDAYESERFVFICGNGGSGANASHLCEDLGKSSLDRHEFSLDHVKRLRVLSLTDNTPYILAWANDEGYDRVFVEQLKNLASPGDRLIAISGSGNSENVLQAVDWANAHEMTTWGVTGFDGGRLATSAQQTLHVPVNEMGLVESMHLLLFHWVLLDLNSRIHERGRHRRQSRVVASL